MSNRPSEPVLAWLRKLLETRHLTVAALAERVRIPRARLRRLLSGAEPMLLDDLLVVSRALEISPADLGLPDAAAGEAEPEPAPEPERPLSAVDPWGNQPRQLVQVAFDLGCSVALHLDPAALAGSGVPEALRKAHAGGLLTLRLDAAYHGYMNAAFEDDALHVDLGFDTLVRCVLPWSALRQVTFWPEPFEAASEQVGPKPAPQAAPPPATEPTRPAERPHLRLVVPDDETGD